MSPHSSGIASGCARPRPIAIVGIGCRLPGRANSPEEFWQLLRNGVDAISEVPADRWSLRKFYHPDPRTPGKLYARWGGFIQGIDQFDAPFFGITPREASRMDPQQRLLLEVSYEAIEDAGLSLDSLAGSKTGVFTGISTYEYGALQGQPNERRKIDGYTNLGGALSIAAARVSYAFDLRGPSLVVDTACSSSLVAMHLACQSLWNGECELALVGGVNLLLSHTQTEGFCKASMLSPDGRCKSFDAAANGYVRAEGAGLLVLQPLDRALADPDQIYALVKATAVNQDGRSTSIAVPDRVAQEAMLREAYERAGVDAAEAQYVEAHGTGTPVGDPIEACAIGNVVGAGRRGGNPCLIGSVKSNIGHLEAGAGVAGVIKAALSLKHREIPASLHFREANPEIPFSDLGLRVADRLQPWPDVGDAPRVAGVNSFGFGGTNAHVVLQEAPDCDRPDAGNSTDASAELLLLSARSRDALRELAASYHHDLVDGPLVGVSLAEVCRAVFHRRSHHDFRLAAAARTTDEMADSLRAFVDGETRLTMSSGRRSAGSEPKVAFVFSGMGPQWWAMGRELLSQQPVFSRTIEQCDALLSQHADWSLRDVLLADEEASRIQETRIAQPAIFALQVGLAALWKSWGVEPAAVVGHSVGEVAAAHVAGALSLEDAVKVIFHRSRLQHTIEGQGQMLAVGLSSEDARRLLDGQEHQVSLAAINSLKSTTLSGDPVLLEQIARRLDEDGVFSRFLNVEVPYHSPMMDAIHEELLESLQNLQPTAGLIPLASTAEGDMVEARELDADYWWRNVRHPVLFEEAMTKLVDCGCNTFLEISAHPVLAPSIRECLGAAGGGSAVIHSLRRQEPEYATMLGNLGRLYTHGCAMDWSRLFSKPSYPVKLPRYPWQHERYWGESAASTRSRLGVDWHPLLGEPMATARRTWNITLDARTPPYLSDHRIQGAVVYPAAAFVEMGLSAARAGLGTSPIVLEEFEILKALLLKEHEAAELQLTLDEDASSFDIQSHSSDADTSWTINVKGRMRLNSRAPDSDPINLQSLLGRCPTEFSSSEFYELLKDAYLEYGPEFRTVKAIRLGENECVLEIRGADPGTEAADSLLPPPVLDACLQAPTLAVRGQGLYLPVYLRKLTFYSTPGQSVWCHARQTNRTDKSIEFDMQVFDEFGNVTVEIIGAKWQSVGQLNQGLSEPTEDFLSRYRWRKTSADQSDGSCGPKKFVSSSTNLAEVLHAQRERLSRELDREEHYEHVSAELNRLTLALVLRALDSLGFQLEAGRCMTEPLLMEELNLSRFCRPLLLRLIDFLQAAGVLRKSDEGWQILSVPQLKSPEQHWRDLLHHRPGYIAELTLIQRYGSGLADLLRDHVDELDLLFPDDITTTVDHLLQDAPTSRISTLLLQEALASAVKDNSEGRTVRILEIGSRSARTGGSVQPHVLGTRSHYVVASTSEEVEGSRAPQGRNSTVAFVNVDLQEEFSEQGLADSTFDVVLLPDGPNACRFQPAVLERIRRLLAPGGLLILREATELPAWIKLILAPVLKPGATEPDDALSTLIREPGALLRDAGFSEVCSVAEPVEQSEFTIFLARNNECEPEEETAPSTDESVVEDQEYSAEWLILSDASELGVALTNQLLGLGHSPIVVEPGIAFEQVGETRFRIRPESCDDMKRLLETITAGGQQCRRIVHLWTLSAPPCSPITGACLERAQVPGCVSVLHLVQALEEAGWQDLPTLRLVTRGAQSVESIMAKSLAATPLWGLARVLMNEQPALQTRVIDLDPEDESNEVALLLAELRNGDADDEVAFRSGIRYVHRLEPISQSEFAATESPSGAEAADADYGVRVEIGTPGILDSLRLKPALREKPGPTQVEIEVDAAALNFKDVAKAMGLLGDASLEGTASGRTLGLECSGTITAVGENVADFQVGDDVFGFARQALGSHAIADARLIDHLPEHLSHEEAATLITVAMTAHYALNYLARVTRGDRVLIHAAAGGVGLAAIQLAQSAGVEIIATAGNPEKRGLLHALGVPHVLDSRSVAFADEVMELTGGRGVDVVLNSLSGEMLTRSFGVLAPFGRFVEIGKRDIEQNNKLGLRPFQNNLSFFAADLDRLCIDKPEVAATVCGDVMQMIRGKTLFPLPHRVFPASRIVEAFRYMTKAKHIGKIVISMDGARDLAPKPEHPLELRSDATYLVTGGLSGFGLATAQWLAERGARHLALVGRSGASTEEARRAVASLTADGVNIVAAKVDVTDEDAVRTLLDEIGASLPPLRGIIHCAMVLDDSILNNLTAERLWRVLAPKVAGAWNLHTATLEADLDFFVMYSSFASLIGNPGQGNYAAANAFLDELCHYRRSLGLPALTVNWGAIADVGIVARSTDVQEHFQRLGITPLPPQRGLDILGQLIRHDLTQSAVSPPADLSRWIQFFPAGIAPRFSRIAGGSATSRNGFAGRDGDDIRGLFLAAEEEQRYEVLEHHMRRTLARVLGASPDKLDVEQPLIEMGIDSLMTVEIVTLIRSELGVEVPPVKFMEGISLAGLSRHIVDELFRRTAPNENATSS